jgi:PBS lyase HEAT-like repeat
MIRYQRLTPVAALLLCLAVGPLGHAQSAPGEIIGEKLPVPGKDVHGTTSKLSEVEHDIVDGMDAQHQAEQLLQYAISHHRGATREIKLRAPQWRGRIALTSSMMTLMDVALNGEDLRVRAAAFEIDLAARNIEKTPETARALIQAVQSDPKNAANAVSATWILGLLANRGVETQRILAELRALRDTDDEQLRYWTVIAIGNIGSDETVPDLLAAFHHDRSHHVSIDAGGCSLAHCGMLTRAQRMQSVPGLIEMVEDPKLDPEIVKYGYRALREITDETFPEKPELWRQWYADHGPETTERFRQFEKVTAQEE